MVQILSMNTPTVNAKKSHQRKLVGFLRFVHVIRRREDLNKSTHSRYSRGWYF